MQLTVQLPPINALTPRSNPVDDVAVHGIQNDDGILVHAQRTGCVDPHAIPARIAQLRINGRGVIAALCGQQ